LTLSSNASSSPSPTRECGTCTLCCKLMYIPEYNSPGGSWCSQCAQGVGCRVYATRPEPCRQFACGWLSDPTTPIEWKPIHSKLVLYMGGPNNTLYVNVDPGSPQAWRKAPYFDRLRLWAKELLNKDRHVVVLVRESATLVLPDETIPMGTLKSGDSFVVHKTYGPTGVQCRVEMIYAVNSRPPSS
jgi:hypothetical protein